MRAIAERTAALSCGWLGVSVFVFGCTGSAATRSDPADLLPPKEVLTKRIDEELEVRAVDYGDEHSKVALRDRRGRELFSIESMPRDSEHVVLTSTMSLAQYEASDAGTFSEQVEIERGEGEGLPLEDQLIGTLIMHGQYAQALLGNYAAQDAQGCDIAKPGPGALGIDWVKVTSCSRKGACCEQHDRCYQMYQCTSDSWSRGKGSEACKACNKLATQCVFSTAAPGPAPCCETGTCGTERGATWMDGDPIPPFPNPTTKTGLDPSLGIGGRRGSPVRFVDSTADGGQPAATGPDGEQGLPEGNGLAGDAGVEGQEEMADDEPDERVEPSGSDDARVAGAESDNAGDEDSTATFDEGADLAEDEDGASAHPDGKNESDNEDRDSSAPDHDDWDDERNFSSPDDEPDLSSPDEEDYGEEDYGEDDYGEGDDDEQEFADVYDECDAYGC